MSMIMVKECVVYFRDNTSAILANLVVTNGCVWGNYQAEHDTKPYVGYPLDLVRQIVVTKR